MRAIGDLALLHDPRGPLQRVRDTQEARDELGRGAPLELEDRLSELIDEPWILSPPDTTNYRAIVGAFRAQGLAAPRIGLKTLSTHLRVNLVGSGKFIAPFPSTVFSFYAERFALKAIPVALPIWPWPVVILTLKNRTLSPVVQSFLGHLRNFFASKTREGEGRKRGA